MTKKDNIGKSCRSREVARFRILLLCYSVTLVLLASCGLVEFEHSENGKLDGYWHLESVDTLSTGGKADLRQERWFWAVQGTVFQLYNPDWRHGQRYVSQFRYENSLITILHVYKDARAQGDPEVESLDVIRPFGINQIEGENFQVEELQGGSMTLSTETLRLQFKKQ